jgi:hypothetical protein
MTSKKLKSNLEGCTIISTHEPCPMCTSALAVSGIETIVFGCSIKRIDLSCASLLTQIGSSIEVVGEYMKQECSVLYNRSVRREIQRLRNSTDTQLKRYNAESAAKRVAWYQNNRQNTVDSEEDRLEAAYRLLLERLKITPEEAPVQEKTERKILFHSQNFCPTLEACIILDLDTRKICKPYNENSTDTLIKQYDKSLTFSRNYDKLRPYTDYCEEMITITGQ